MCALPPPPRLFSQPVIQMAPGPKYESLSRLQLTRLVLRSCISQPAYRCGCDAMPMMQCRDALHCVFSGVPGMGSQRFTYPSRRGRRRFLGLTSKVAPLDSMLNFDADVKNTTARHQCENRFFFEMEKTGHMRRVLVSRVRTSSSFHVGTAQGHF